MDQLAYEAIVGKPLVSCDALDFQGWKQDAPMMSVLSGSDVVRIQDMNYSTDAASCMVEPVRPAPIRKEATIGELTFSDTGLVFLCLGRDFDIDTVFRSVFWEASGLTTTPDSPRRRTRSVDQEYMLYLMAAGAHLPPAIYASFRDRLRTILDADELKNEGITPRQESFFDLIEFFSKQKSLRAPTLGITRRGNFVASWRAARDKLVTSQFLGEKRINWLIFAPGTDDSSMMETAAGETSFQNIMRRVRSFKADQWMKRGD